MGRDLRKGDHFNNLDEVMRVILGVNRRGWMRKMFWK